MKARLLKLAWAVAAVLRDAAGVGLMLLLAALGFALFTESGAVLSLRALERTTGTLQIEGVDGRLWGELRLHSLRYEDDAVAVRAQQIELHWSPLSLLSRQVSVSRLHVAELDLLLKPQPEPPPQTSAEVISELPLALRLDDIALARLQVQAPDAEPLVLEGLALSADWRGADMQLNKLAAITPWVGAVKLEGQARLRSDAVDITRLHASGFVEAQLQGRFGYGATPSDLKLSWQDLRWPPPVAADTDTDAQPQLSSARGELQWKGRYEDYQYRIKAALTAAGYPLDVAAEGSGTLTGLRAEALKIQALNGQIAARALIDWHDGLRIDADGSLDQLDLQALHAQLEGRINGRFRAQSAVENETPRVDFELALADSELRGYALRLDAKGRYTGVALELAQFDLRSGSTRLQAQGRVWPQLDASATLLSPDLAALWPGLSGRARAQLTARGQYAQPQVDIDANVDALRYGELRLAQARLDTRIDLARSIALDLSAQGLQAGAEIRTLKLGIHGPLSAHRIDLSAAAAQGDFALHVAGALDPRARSWRGQLLSGQLAPDRLAAWTLQAPAVLAIGAASGLDLAPACWTSGEALACLRVQRSGRTQRLAFRLQAFEIGSLAPLLPTGTQLQAVLDGNGVIALDDSGLRELQAQLHSTPGIWRQAGLPPLRWRAADFKVAEAAHGTEVKLNLPLEEGLVDLQALLAGGGALMQRALSGQLRVTLPDLAFARAFSPELQEVVGRIDGEWTLAGTLQQPRPQGALVLSEGRLRLATPGIELRELQARVDADGAQPLRVRASARADQGELYIEGDIDPWSSPLRLDLKLSGYNAQVVRTPQVKVWVSPNLTVALAQQQLRVAGTVEVPSAQIAPTSLSSGVSPSADQIIVVGDSDTATEGVGIFADIGLRLGDAVRFEGFGLETRLTGALQLREQPGTATSGRGEINLIDGRYKAYGQDLDIETGRLLFSGGAVTAPAVELRAARQPRPDICVGVLVRGTLEKPQLSLFSTPAMAQQQQLSWLILGRDLEQSAGTEDREMLAGAALSMGLAGGEWLAQRLGGAIGIDEIALGARPGETAEQAQLTVGKYLRPGLFISYGIGLFQPGHSFKLEYDIGGGFKLATESGVESGGDLLYTIEPKANIKAPESPEPVISGE